MTVISIYPKKKASAVGIEKLCAEMGLTMAMKGCLKSIAQNTHWHFKSGKLKGVLEITLMDETGEVILAVHENRKGDWIKDALTELQKQIG